MAKKEKKKPAHLDDFLDELKEKHSKSLDESFKAYDAFNKEENLNHFFNNVFSPAQDELYKTIKEELDKALGGDDAAKLHGKNKEVKKAVTTGLKKYFDKAHPSVTKLMADLEMGEDEQYDFLTGMYDEHVGVGTPWGKQLKVGSIKTLENLARDKKNTVGHIKRYVYAQKNSHAESALHTINNKYLNHHFSKYHPTEIAAYLKSKLEKEGFEIEDRLGYATADLGDLLGLRKGIIEKEGHSYLKKKEEKEK